MLQEIRIRLMLKHATYSYARHVGKRPAKQKYPDTLSRPAPLIEFRGWQWHYLVEAILLRLIRPAGSFELQAVEWVRDGLPRH